MATVGDIRPGTIYKLGLYFVLLAILWFSPVPEGMDPTGWRILAVFAATIFSFIIRLAR